MLPAEFPDVLETFRVLFESMDFFEDDGAGWKSVGSLCDDMYFAKRDEETKSRLAFEVLRLSSFEIMANMNTTKYVKLLYCLLHPEFMRISGSAELLSLGGEAVIDEPLAITDGYTLLHWRVMYCSSSDSLNAVLSKNPDLHKRGFDARYSPLEESPTTLAMYNSRNFDIWRLGLVNNGVSLSEFVHDELEQNCDLHLGWEGDTLLELFENCAYNAHILNVPFHYPYCQDCGKLVRTIVIQPYWRHLLESIRTRHLPCDTAGLYKEALSDEVAEEDEEEKEKEEIMEFTSSDLERNAIEDSSLNDPSDALSALDLGAESDGSGWSVLDRDIGPRRYPSSIFIRADCLYGCHEVVCMDCWLYYDRNGTRRPPPLNEELDLDTHTLQSNELSEDEYSPFHVHT